MVRKYKIQIDIFILIASAIVCMCKPSYPVAFIFAAQLAFIAINRWMSIKQPQFDVVTPRIDKLEKDLARLTSVISLKG